MNSLTHPSPPFLFKITSTLLLTTSTASEGHAEKPICLIIYKSLISSPIIATFSNWIVNFSQISVKIFIFLSLPT